MDQVIRSRLQASPYGLNLEWASLLPVQNRPLGLPKVSATGNGPSSSAQPRGLSAALPQALLLPHRAWSGTLGPHLSLPSALFSTCSRSLRPLPCPPPPLSLSSWQWPRSQRILGSVFVFCLPYPSRAGAPQGRVWVSSVAPGTQQPSGGVCSGSPSVPHLNRVTPSLGLGASTFIGSCTHSLNTSDHGSKGSLSRCHAVYLTGHPPEIPGPGKSTCSPLHER